MNKITFLPLLACLLVDRLNAQVQAQQQTQAPYSIVARDLNSRVWARTNFVTGPDGQLEPQVQSYTELQTGVCYADESGNLQESKAEIDILPNGSGAAATNGQHKVYFPPDIYGGQIELNTLDNQWLRSQVLGLSYYDTSSGQSVLIAELTNSTGVVQGDNVVIYPNAFTDISADIRYTYTISGFEQDVILKRQPPSPTDFGLNPESTRLEVETEFFNPPTPTITPITNSLPTAGEADECLRFGAMVMGPGHAFSDGTQSGSPLGTPVMKQWNVIDGRFVLFESVPLSSLASQIQGLPPVARSSTRNTTRQASTKRFLPPARLARTNGRLIKMARVPAPSKGIALDYSVLEGDETNFTFQGNTTYVVSNLFSVYNSVTIEGGTVVKYVSNWGGEVSFINCQIICNTGPYRPAICTSADDNTVGSTIAGSSGAPTMNQTGGIYLSIYGGGAQQLHDLRMAYAYVGMAANSLVLDVTNISVVDSDSAIWPTSYLTMGIHNALIANVLTGLNLQSANVSIENMTADQCGQLIYYSYTPASLALTNCLFTSITNWIGWYTNYGVTTFYDDATNSTGAGVYQTVGAGNYYLASGSPYRDVGTTNISPGLLAAFKHKTTYPPLLLVSNSTSINLTLGPQAQRDTDIPDLGWHYDPLDYIVDQFDVTNGASISVTNGAAIGAYFNSGILLVDATSLTSIGTPLAPNWFVSYQSVQEQPVTIDAFASLPINPYYYTAPASGTFQFTKFAGPAGSGYQLYNSQDPWKFNPLSVQECEFWNGTTYMGGGSNATAILNNNLFSRSTFATTTGVGTNYTLSLSNNTFYASLSISMKQRSGCTWYAFNNVFDTCNFAGPTSANRTCTNGYNAYINCTNQLSPSYVGDIVQTNLAVWLAGPLGNFYQPSNSPFIEMGSTNANLIGLYHYTTQTNAWSVEGTNIVDMGYHYVGVDTNGNPIDTNGDGIPDYLEDANGDGLVDNGELSWTNYNSINGLSNPNGILVFTPLK